MKKNFIVLTTSLLIIIINGCKKEPLPTVEFTFSPTSALVNETITFTNTSQDATSYAWDFGDGSSSTIQNPSHSYASAGTFTITLTATGDGGVSTGKKSISITYPAPTAGFTMDKTSAHIDEPIAMTNTSLNAKTYTWDFGDGSSSTSQNPSHSYASAGTFTITLTATGDGGTSTVSNSIVITKPPFNIIPGVGAMNISLAETWQSVKPKLGTDYTQYGPLMLSSSTKTYIIHPVESKSKGILLYFLSVTTSMTFNSADVVFLIDLKENFVGETEKGIKMGSSLNEVIAAYGNPTTHDLTNKVYRYPGLGIAFYYNNSSVINEITIMTPSTKKHNEIVDLLIEKIKN